MPDYDDYQRSGYAGPIPPVNEGRRVLGQIDASGFHPVVTADSTSVLTEERVVDAETGGMKGKKLASFSSLPSDVLWELAEHFGKGERKYPNDPETGKPNWQKGYDWRLNVDALQRHLHLWLQGQDVDEETGSNHLIAVIWHAMVLRWFQIHGKGKDYR